MIDHVSLGTNRYAQAVAFYQRVLEPLGLTLLRDTRAKHPSAFPRIGRSFSTPFPWRKG